MEDSKLSTGVEISCVAVDGGSAESSVKKKEVRISEHPSDLLSTEMKTAIKTLTNYQYYIKNTIEPPYTNGVLEGINNKIKVIKRIAFGYRSFYHFKARILIIHKYTFEQKN